MSETHEITLGELRSSGRKVIAECIDCGHNKKLDPKALELPPETPVTEIAKRLKCTCCEGKRPGTGRRVTTRPESVRDARKGHER